MIDAYLDTLDLEASIIAFQVGHPNVQLRMDQEKGWIVLKWRLPLRGLHFVTPSERQIRRWCALGNCYERRAYRQDDRQNLHFMEIMQ